MHRAYPNHVSISPLGSPICKPNHTAAPIWVLVLGLAVTLQSVYYVDAFNFSSFIALDIKSVCVAVADLFHNMSTFAGDEYCNDSFWHFLTLYALKLCEIQFGNPSP
jgi:hypothetical protein